MGCGCGLRHFRPRLHPPAGCDEPNARANRPWPCAPFVQRRRPNSLWPCAPFARSEGSVRDLAFQRTVTPSLPAVSRTDAHRIVYGCFERRLEAVLSVCVMSPFLLGRTLLRHRVRGTGTMLVAACTRQRDERERDKSHETDTVCRALYLTENGHARTCVPDHRGLGVIRSSAWIVWGSSCSLVMLDFPSTRSALDDELVLAVSLEHPSSCWPQGVPFSSGTGV